MNNKRIMTTPETTELINLFRQYCEWQSKMIALTEEIDVENEIAVMSGDLYLAMATLIGSVVTENISNRSDGEYILI